MLSFRDYVVKKQATPVIHEIAVMMANKGIEPQIYIKEYLHDNHPLIAEGIFQALGRAWRSLWASDESPKAKYDSAVTSLTELESMLKKWKRAHPQVMDGVLKGIANSLRILRDMNNYIAQIDTRVRTLSGAQTHSGVSAQGINMGDDESLNLPKDLKARYDTIVRAIASIEDDPSKIDEVKKQQQALRDLYAEIRKHYGNLDDQNPAEMQRKRQIGNFLQRMLDVARQVDVDLVINPKYGRVSSDTIKVERPIGWDQAVRQARGGDEALRQWFDSLPANEPIKQYIGHETQHSAWVNVKPFDILKLHVDQWRKNQSSSSDWSTRAQGAIGRDIHDVDQEYEAKGIIPSTVPIEHGRSR